MRAFKGRRDGGREERRVLVIDLLSRTQVPLSYLLAWNLTHSLAGGVKGMPLLVNGGISGLGLRALMWSIWGKGGCTEVTKSGAEVCSESTSTISDSVFEFNVSRSILP